MMDEKTQLKADLYTILMEIDKLVRKRRELEVRLKELENK